MYRGYDLVTRAAKEETYSITWGYICDHMKSDYGLNRNSTKRFSMFEIEQMLDVIWSDFYASVVKRKLEIERGKDEAQA